MYRNKWDGMINVVANIADFQGTPRSEAIPLHGTAQLINLKTKKDREMARKSVDQRKFEAAETLYEFGDANETAIEMMMTLACESRSPTIREKAATWLWRVIRLKVVGDDGGATSKVFRRR